MDCLTYPFDSAYILKKKKSIKRELLVSGKDFIHKKIAVLGGSTTAEIKNILELFLLHYGINTEFYESEYGQYWHDAMFGEEFRTFNPDIVYIHTSSRNITALPTLRDGKEKIDEMLEQQFLHFTIMWDRLLHEYACTVIQNNFERPAYRLLGNKDISDFHGHSNFILRLNRKFYGYAQEHKGFYINDIDYLSSSYGLKEWSDASCWYMYKYALCILAIPDLAFSVANIIKSVYGKNKKAFVLDLDNTLWGGVIGDDSVDGIELGPETSSGQAYGEFQEYIKAHKDLGVIFSICSKNDEENAVAGLKHPDSKFSPDDFVVIKANWENKDQNILEIAKELNIGADSLVFVDDNPAERAIVAGQFDGIATPDIGNVVDYIHRIDNSGFFETTTVTADDFQRLEMYKENAQRMKMQRKFENYTDYLKSLEMVAVIREFEPLYTQRIAQLTNKSNQFNLTTKRYSEGDIEYITGNNNYIKLYGRLADKFGDNGVVSIVIGHKDGRNLHIDLWLMSCRVLKRNMELAMIDKLVEECRSAMIRKLIGYYYPSAKNNMVRDFYDIMGFKKISEDADGNMIWEYDICGYVRKNYVIEIKS